MPAARVIPSAPTQGVVLHLGAIQARDRSGTQPAPLPKGRGDTTPATTCIQCRRDRYFYQTPALPAFLLGACGLPPQCPMDVMIVAVASLLAGFVDAIVGGGGLILLPALFAVFPSAPPATLLGVNKGSSVWGTAAATSYPGGCNCAGNLWRLGLRWRPALCRCVAVTVVIPIFAPSCPGVAGRLYTWRKAWGNTPSSDRVRWGCGLLGGGGVLRRVLFGTGALCFCWCAGWAMTLHASASAKPLNTASVWPLCPCSPGGTVVAPGEVMAVACDGRASGTRLALKHGVGFAQFYGGGGCPAAETGWSAELDAGGVTG